jgi:transposase
VVAVSVTAGSSADGPELIPLLKQTVDAGKVEEFLADKAYLSEANLAAIDEVGAAGYIPFKSNSRGDRGSDLWRRGYAAFMFDNPTWRRHYHLRSNAESTFSSLKRTLGGNLRSKKFRPQVNEVLCKTIAHNIARLVHAIHRHGLETKFRPFEAA